MMHQGDDFSRLSLGTPVMGAPEPEPVPVMENEKPKPAFTVTDRDPNTCTCGNFEMGFDCVCDWVRAHPGDNEYTCEFCGIYKASAPKCNCCEKVT